MRVLIACDGSAGALQAVALAEAVAWPAGSTLRLVSVIEPVALMAPPPWPSGGLAAAPALEAQAIAELEAELAGVVGRLSSPGRDVEGVVLRGRPASVIVDDARDFGADLVIVGSRGHGTIATLVLGSVSAEVVDHAPCPVLVARRATLERILFATDASPSAAAAQRILVRWPIFDGLPIHVVSVADVVHPWLTGIAPTMYGPVMDVYAQELEAAEAEHRRIAEDTATRLREAGHAIRVELRSGDAAAEVIAVAEAWPADLVVLGSRGRTGLARIVLGSVARNVVHGCSASVLVVRQG